jgi:steroid delta-isomerase-like uncharacterized protein
LARRSGRPSRAGVGAFCLAICLTIALLTELGTELALAYRTPDAARDDRQDAANAILVARFYADAWNGGSWLGLAADVAADHRYHDPYLPNAAVGPEGMAQVVSGFRRAFPDLVLTLDGVVVTGDRVVVRFTMRGTHRGTFLGADGTGRAVATTGVAVHRIADGRIAETWVVWDTLRLAVQLGLAVVPVSVLAQGDRWDGAPSSGQPGHPS